jgi:hypothetical protein
MLLRIAPTMFHPYSKFACLESHHQLQGWDKDLYRQLEKPLLVLVLVQVQVQVLVQVQVQVQLRCHQLV